MEYLDEFEDEYEYAHNHSRHSCALHARSQCVACFAKWEGNKGPGASSVEDIVGMLMVAALLAVAAA